MSIYPIIISYIFFIIFAFSPLIRMLVRFNTTVKILYSMITNLLFSSILMKLFICKSSISYWPKSSSLELSSFVEISFFLSLFSILFSSKILKLLSLSSSLIRFIIFLFLSLILLNRLRNQLIIILIISA